MKNILAAAFVSLVSLAAFADDRLYCVIDLSAGPDADEYPVSYLSDVPEGGWTDEYKTDKLVLRKIEPGDLMMGGVAKVVIDEPFYIGVFELTKKQYYLVCGKECDYYYRMRGTAFPEQWSPYPENHVTYNDLRGGTKGLLWPDSCEVDDDSFIGRLRSRISCGVADIPTEAQWEYACRAGTTSKYNNGGDSADDLNLVGRYRGNGGDGKPADGNMVRVGEFLPNAWGLYDMHGNLFEWCLDRGPWGGAVDVEPAGNPECFSRSLRGGSMDYTAEECTSSFRYYMSPNNDSAFFGARICLNGVDEEHAWYYWFNPLNWFDWL